MLHENAVERHDRGGRERGKGQSSGAGGEGEPPSREGGEPETKRLAYLVGGPGRGFLAGENAKWAFCSPRL